MRFVLSIPKKKYCFQEPIIITFRLTATRKTVKVPLEYKRTDAISVSLYDSSKKLLQHSTGYDLLRRIQGGRQQIVSQDKQTKVDLPKEKTLEWTENLL